MEKSGNAIANALAYNTEYATTRARMKYAEEAARKKGCDLRPKTAATAPVKKGKETARSNARDPLILRR